MQRIKKYIKSRKATKDNCLRFASYIKKGWYFLSVNKSTFCFIKTNFLRVLISLKRAYFLKGNGPFSSFSIISGTEKINFITNKFVVSQYFTSDVSLDKIRENIEKYLPKLQLPHSDYLKFDDKKKEFLTNTVLGNSFSDKSHTVKLMSTIINKALVSEVKIIVVNKVPVMFLVQHGDAYGNNIIWQDDDNFTCIDNENVGLYPAFYDAFMLASINCTNVDEFLEFNEKYIPFYENFCKSNKIDFSNFLDKYISYFIFFRSMSYQLERRNQNHRPFVFMQDSKFKNLFPESYKVLSAILNNERIHELERLYVESGHQL